MDEYLEGIRARKAPEEPTESKVVAEAAADLHLLYQRVADLERQQTTQAKTIIALVNTVERLRSRVMPAGLGAVGKHDGEG